MDWTDSLLAATRTVERIFTEVRGKASIRYAMMGARLILPYVLHPMNDKPKDWIWLNRDYKPLGTHPQWADYEKYTHLHIQRDDPRIARLIPQCKPIWEGDAYYLFSDRTSPFLNYANARKYAELLMAIDCQPTD